MTRRKKHHSRYRRTFKKQALTISAAGYAFIRPREDLRHSRKICQDLSGTYAINATPLTDLSPALVAPGLLNSCRLRIARAEALILRAWSWALCKLDVVETCQWARKTEKNFHDWLPSSSSNTCSSFFALLSYIKSWIRPKRIKPIRVSGVLLLTLMEVNYKLWNFLLFMPRGVLYIK